MVKKLYVLIVMAMLMTAASVTAFAAAASDTIITSDTLDVDYKRFTAIFHGNVVLNDPQMHMTSEEMRVFFKKNNKDDKKDKKDESPASNVAVSYVTALGNVKIKADGRTAICDRAIYSADHGKIIMTGKVVLERDGNVMRGDKVTFWVSEKAKLESATVDQNSLRAVLAEGNVRMESGNKTAECGRAVYTESNGKVIMTKKAALHQKGDSLYGDKIIFWLNESGMDNAEATGNVRMVYGSSTEEEAVEGEQKKKEKSDGGE